NNSLKDISCFSSGSSIAAGRYLDSRNVLQTLIESWDGADWSRVASPNRATTINHLDSVSCLSLSSCVAVGAYTDSQSDLEQTLIESWDGTRWSVVTSPNRGTGYSSLSGVACLTSSFCVAVGS